jgi:hypothetical protein
MLPVGSNTKSSTCSVLSSNCVIWHGADIPCIGLCKSDTVTDVILKLGELVCNIEGRAGDITVNTECLGSGSVTWDNYNDLIQYLTDRLCNLYTIVNDIVIPSPINLTADVATCLQAAAGGATLGVVEYAELIGTTLCTALSDITTLESTVSTHSTQITTINNTLSTLNLTYAPINSTYVCLSTGADTLVNIVATIEQELCDLELQTGSPAELAVGLQPYCDLTNEPALSAAGTMATAYPEWNVTVSNLAQSMKNLWITVCDMRTKVNLLADCCASTCADIVLGFYGTLSTSTLTVRANTGSSLPADFTQCPLPGSTITITDGLGASFTTTFNNIEALVAGGFQDIDLSTSGLDLATDFSVQVAYCFTNMVTGLQCQNTVNFNVINTIACPLMSLSSTWNNVSNSGTVGYSFNNLYVASATTKYRVRLYDAGLTIVGSTTTAVASTLPNPVTGSFPVSNIGSYTVEISIISVNPSTGVETVVRVCTSESVVVTNTTCLPPTNLTAYNIN